MRQCFRSVALLTVLGCVSFTAAVTPIRAAKADAPPAFRFAKIFTDKEEKYSSYRACRGCRYLYQCSVCPVSIGHIPGNTDPNRVPDLQCAFNLAVLTAREKFFEATHEPCH